MLVAPQHILEATWHWYQIEKYLWKVDSIPSWRCRCFLLTKLFTQQSIGFNCTLPIITSHCIDVFFLQFGWVDVSTSTRTRCNSPTCSQMISYIEVFFYLTVKNQSLNSPLQISSAKKLFFLGGSPISNNLSFGSLQELKSLSWWGQLMLQFHTPWDARTVGGAPGDSFHELHPRRRTAKCRKKGMIGRRSFPLLRWYLSLQTSTVITKKALAPGGFGSAWVGIWSGLRNNHTNVITGPLGRWEVVWRDGICSVMSMKKAMDLGPLETHPFRCCVLLESVSKE